MGAVLEYGALLALLAAALLLLAAMLQRRGRRAVATAPAGDDASSARLGAVEKAVVAAEGRAAAAERDAAILVELVGVGAVRVAPDLTVAAANAVAHRLVGRRPGAMVGRSVLEAFTDHHADEIVRTALETGSAVGELTVRLEQGPTLLARARRTPGGEAWLVLEDVSELRRLQRIRTEFIDNLSHELRTPLTTVSLLAETLAADADSLPPKAAERVNKIEVETGHLVQMVNELLDLSRIESGIATVALDDIDLGRLAAATADRMRLFAERQGVTLEVVAPGAVPLVRGDRERLGQALLNLLHNAVKFSPPESTVTIRVTPAESEVVVAVEDHGAGDSAQRPAPDLRALLQGGPRPDAGCGRDRPGALDRAPHRGGARRPDLGRVAGGDRLDVLVRHPGHRAGPGGDAGRLSVLLLAHRGDHRTAPENSLAAFRAALAIPGIDGLELDVRASADGVAVVLHDASLRRVQGRRIRASRLTAAELAGHGVPTLAAVLAACRPGAFLDVELKEDLGTAAMAPLRAARGERDGRFGGVVVSSFHRGALATVRRLEPAMPCWLNTAWLSDRVIQAAVDLGCSGIAAEWHRIDARRVERVLAAGLDLAAWTVRDPGARDRLAEMGVAAACVEGSALPE